jgi:hypothetical protein
MSALIESGSELRSKSRRYVPYADLGREPMLEYPPDRDPAIARASLK